MDSSGREWLISIICLTVILLASANQSFGCPPPFCEACQSYFFPSCTDDDTQDESGGETTPDDCGYCQECSEGDCVNDDAGGNSDDVCFGCQTCQSGVCAPDDDECTECLGCFGFTCDVKHENCPGECNQCMSDGSCQKFDVLCHDCEKCDETTGNCVDDGETCEGCKTCNSAGNCEDDNNAPECNSETCDKCTDGICIPGGLCAEGQCCDNGVCGSSCSSGKCCDDSVCVSECSGDNCCDEGTCEALEGCESCIGGVATDDKDNCTGECKNCIDANCQDDDELCDPGDECVNGTCCDTASAGDCEVDPVEDFDYNALNCFPKAGGQCIGGVGYHVESGWTEVSTHQDQKGPGTVSISGCANVTYWVCTSYWNWNTFTWYCDTAYEKGEQTTNFGTHKECPSE